MSATESTEVLPPLWLVEAFYARGGGCPRLLGNIRNTVWGDGQTVAKVYHRGVRHEDVLAEVSAANLARNTGIPTPQPYDFGTHEGRLLSWWEQADVSGTATWSDTAQLCRALHDRCWHPVDEPIPHFSASLPPEDTHAIVNTSLAAALRPWRASWQRARERLAVAPRVLVHGDAIPTNTASTPNGPILFDFGASQWGPRVLDVATMITVAAETGQARSGEILSDYRRHPDVGGAMLQDALFAAQVQRTWSCVYTAGRESEGWDRLQALRAHQMYRYPEGQGLT